MPRLSFHEAAALAAALAGAERQTDPMATVRRELGVTNTQLTALLKQAEEIGLVIRPEGRVALTPGGAALASAVQRAEAAAKQKMLAESRLFTDYLPTRVSSDLS